MFGTDIYLTVHTVDYQPRLHERDTFTMRIQRGDSVAIWTPEYLLLMVIEEVKEYILSLQKPMPRLAIVDGQRLNAGLAERAFTAHKDGKMLNDLIIAFEPAQERIDMSLRVLVDTIGEWEIFLRNLNCGKS